MQLDIITAILMASAMIAIGVLVGVLICHKYILDVSAELDSILKPFREYKHEFDLHLKLIKRAYNFAELWSVRNSIRKKALAVRYDDKLDIIEDAFKKRLDEIKDKKGAQNG